MKTTVLANHIQILDYGSVSILSCYGLRVAVIVYNQDRSILKTEVDPSYCRKLSIITHRNTFLMMSSETFERMIQENEIYEVNLNK